MTDLRLHGRLWLRLVRLHLLGLLEYRLDFFVGVTSMFFIHLGTFLMFYLVFDRIQALAGFSFAEVAFIFGFSILPQGVVTTLASSLFGFGNLIRGGEMDRILLRPVDPLFQVVATRVDANGLGNALIGLGLVGWAAPRAGVPLDPGHLLLFLVLLLASSLVLFSVNVIVAASAFWTVRNDSAMRILQEMDEFSAYPLPVFPGSVRMLLTWVIPLAFTGFYPACLLIGRSEYQLGGWMTLLAAPLCYLVARVVFGFGLRRYESTGH